MNQRWRNQRAFYRPNGEVIRTSKYEICAIEHDRDARGFIEAHHYSRSYPAGAISIRFISAWQPGWSRGLQSSMQRRRADERVSLLRHRRS